MILRGNGGFPTAENAETAGKTEMKKMGNVR
jgi:hypothetical protein